MTPVEEPAIVDRATWTKARKELLVKEKELTRRKDELARERQALPRVRLDKSYIFESDSGPRSLADLFDGRPQLVVYHFMMGPDWEEGCPSCSFWADNYDGIGVHLAHRDTTLIAVSRAPLESIQVYKQRMGWTLPWVSSLGNDFNVDFAVSFPDGGSDGATYNFEPIDDPPEELPGISVFLRDDSESILHTYSAYSRGLDVFNGAYQLLDMTPMGRHEEELPWSMAWLSRHDSYDD